MYSSIFSFNKVIFSLIFLSVFSILSTKLKAQEKPTIRIEPFTYNRAGATLLQADEITRMVNSHFSNSNKFTMLPLDRTVLCRTLRQRGLMQDDFLVVTTCDFYIYPRRPKVGKLTGINGDAYGRYERGEVRPTIEMVLRLQNPIFA